MIKPLRTFASDNFSGVDPEVMSFLNEINVGHMQSYEGDEITKRAEKLFVDEFGDGTRVLFVPSGTGANILSLKLLLEKPYEAVVVSEVSHVFEEETGALSANTGAHVFTVSHENGKISFEALKNDIELRKSLGFHSALPKVVSIASTTEYGTYYTTREVRQIAEYCHANGLYLHMDGCRLPNAVAAIGCSLREYTRDAGVDVLSFGGAKNGLMSAEAVVIFNAPESDILRMQKQSMQLVSKMRYVSGQFVPYLENKLWLKNAHHSNELAQILEKGLREKLGDVVQFTQPTETNQVFCIIPESVKQALRNSGHQFYNWNSPGEVRFVTAWDNDEEDVIALLTIVEESMGK